MTLEVSRRAETGLRAIAALALTAAGPLGLAWLGELGVLDPARCMLGAVALPAACVLAAMLLVRREAATDALALGLTVPVGATLLDHPPGTDWIFAARSAVAVGMILTLACLAVSLRRPADAARSRVIFSTLAVAPLTPLLAQTLFWAPRHFTLSGYGDRVTLHPLMVIAALAAALAIFELQRRSARALVWLLVLAVAIDTSPSWGEHQSGCMGMPGPIDSLAWMIAWRRQSLGPLALLAQLLRPPVLTLLALAPWIGPVWRALRTRSNP